MNARNTAIGSAVVALLAVSGSVRAAESHHCAAVLKNSRRLACYDATFGKPVRPVAAQPPQAAAPAPAKPVSARITEVSRILNDRFAITLDNGQVWTQLERDLSAEVHAGDTVQIRPALLGSWMLETRGGVRTRVRLTR
jgi:hypothetical protein